MDSVTLARVVAAVESGNRPSAIRFERAQLDHARVAGFLAKIADINRCSIDTARMIAACSWGAYQIMGFNLYSPPISLDIPAFVYLLDTARQELSFVQFVSAAHQTPVPVELLRREVAEGFAHFYNGPGNVQAYADKLQTAARNLLGC